MFVVWPGEVEEQEGDDGGEEEGGEVTLRVPAALTVSPLPHWAANNRVDTLLGKDSKKKKKFHTATRVWKIPHPHLFLDLFSNCTQTEES